MCSDLYSNQDKVNNYKPQYAHKLEFASIIDLIVKEISTFMPTRLILWHVVFFKICLTTYDYRSDV